MALAGPGTLAAAPLGAREVQPPVVVTRDAGPLDAHNSPRVAVNPADPDNVVLVERADAQYLSAGMHVSTDGGRTWSSTPLPLPDGTGRADGPPVDLDDNGDVVFVETQRRFAPDVAFAPDGTLYVTYLNLMGQGNVPDNLWVARSDDGGATLSDPVRVSGPNAYQPRIVVDPDGIVVVTYVQGGQVGTWSLTGPAPLVATRSADGGATFADPVVISDTDRLRVGAATPVIDADGDLVVLYQDFEGDVRDFENLEGPVWDGPTTLVVTRSDDAGATFSPGVVVDDQVRLGGRFIVFLPVFPSIAAGPDGGLYVAWADARGDDQDVLLRRSDDGGDTWQDPVRVNAPDTGGTQSLPAVSTAETGRVDVVYLDRGGDPADVMAHVSLATSTDRGGSFETARLTDEPFDATIGPTSIDSYALPGVGSGLGLASWDDGALAAWTDTRLGQDEPSNGRQDVVVATVTDLPAAAAAGGFGSWWPWALLAAGAALALVAAGWWRIRRRRPG